MNIKIDNRLLLIKKISAVPSNICLSFVILVTNDEDEKLLADLGDCRTRMRNGGQKQSKKRSREWFTERNKKTGK